MSPTLQRYPYNGSCRAIPLKQKEGSLDSSEGGIEFWNRACASQDDSMQVEGSQGHARLEGKDVQYNQSSRVTDQEEGCWGKIPALLLNIRDCAKEYTCLIDSHFESVYKAAPWEHWKRLSKDAVSPPEIELWNRVTPRSKAPAPLLEFVRRRPLRCKLRTCFVSNCSQHSSFWVTMSESSLFWAVEGDADTTAQKYFCSITRCK